MIRSHLRRIALVLVILLLPFIGLAGWRAYDLYTGVRTITEIKVMRTSHEPTVTIPPLNSNQRINFLLLGSDNDKKIEEARPLAQSIIVVTVDPQNDTVGMMSIPRDFYVPIRGHGWNKIDLAYKFGGVALARETVEHLFNIPIDYYAWVGLDGFTKVIDTFNGVTINVSHPILDDSYPDDMNTVNPYGYKRVFIPPGWQHLDGSQALEYVRSRHGDLISDFGRSARQQQILLQLNTKLSTLNVLRNLPALVDELKCCVRTDLSVEQLYQIGQLAQHISLSQVTQRVLQVPTYSHYGWSPDGQSIVVPDWPKIRPLVAQMFAPIQPAPPHAATRRATPPAKPTTTRKIGPPPKATATPAPTSTPTVPSVSAKLLYVSAGNLFERLPSGSSTQLTFTGDVSMPSLSPDRKSVAVVRSISNVSNLWIINLTTHKMRPITSDINPLSERPPEVRNNLWAEWPSWSSDGRSIAFSSDRAKLSEVPSDARPTDLAIWTVSAEGGAGLQVTSPQRGSGGDTEPSWRPHSSQFVFVKWNYTSHSNKPYSQLVLFDTATHIATPLTRVGDKVLDPGWNAGGNLLTYVRNRGQGDQVIVARFAGGHLVPLVALAFGEVAKPSFTPNGRWVSYVAGNMDTFQGYLSPVNGGPQIAIPGLPNSIDARSAMIWIR